MSTELFIDSDLDNFVCFCFLEGGNGGERQERKEEERGEGKMEGMKIIDFYFGFLDHTR